MKSNLQISNKQSDVGANVVVAIASGDANHIGK